jgi:hypothetical protein
MPDTATHTDIALATGATSASIIAGASVSELYLVASLALIGGVISHIWLAKMSFSKMLASIAGSTILGVVLAMLSTKFVVATAAHFMPWLVQSLIDAELMAKMLVAFAISFCAQKAVPIFFHWLDQKGGASA